MKYFPAAVSGETESEDCLFLDVVVPVAVFENRQKRKPAQDVNSFNVEQQEIAKRVKRRSGEGGAPVLFNIHGGGFFIGDKRTNYDPQALLQEAENGVIFVSANYRVCLNPLIQYCSIQDTPTSS